MELKISGGPVNSEETDEEYALALYSFRVWYLPMRVKPLVFHEGVKNPARHTIITGRAPPPVVARLGIRVVLAGRKVDARAVRDAGHLGRARIGLAAQHEIAVAGRICRYGGTRRRWRHEGIRSSVSWLVRSFVPLVGRGRSNHLAASGIRCFQGRWGRGDRCQRIRIFTRRIPAF